MARKPFTTGSVLGDLGSYASIAAVFGFFIFPSTVLTNLLDLSLDDRVITLGIAFCCGAIVVILFYHAYVFEANQSANEAHPTPVHDVDLGTSGQSETSKRGFSQTRSTRTTTIDHDTDRDGRVGLLLDKIVRNTPVTIDKVTEIYGKIPDHEDRQRPSDINFNYANPRNIEVSCNDRYHGQAFETRVKTSTKS